MTFLFFNDIIIKITLFLLLLFLLLLLLFCFYYIPYPKASDYFKNTVKSLTDIFELPYYK